MNQLDADLHRFFARRIVQGAILLAIAIAIVSVAIPTARGDKAATSQYGQMQVGTNPDGSPVFAPSSSTSGDTRVAVGKSLSGTLQGVSIVMIFVSVVLGASFVGAEFNLGSLTSQLIYEPRRWRVHTSKAVTAALGCAAFAVLLCVVLGLLLFVGSEINGIVSGINASWWRSRGGQLGRAAGASAAAAVMGYATAVVTRRTSAAIVVFFAMYPIIGIIDPSTAVFGPLSRFAPLRGLLSIAIDTHGNGGGDLELLTRTSAGAVAMTVTWIAILMLVSGRLFSRAEIR